MAKTWEDCNGGQYKWGVRVYQRPGESQEHLIKRFMKKVQKHRVLQEWSRKQEYKKPSVKRRERLAKSRARQRKALRDETTFLPV